MALINKRKFETTVLDENTKTFVIYVTILFATPTLAI